MQKTLAASFRQALIDSWWVVAIALICIATYERGINERNQQFTTLTNNLSALNNEIKLARKEQIGLAREVGSQNDPEWIELILKRELGLTPEGQTKVIWISM